MPEKYKKTLFATKGSKGVKSALGSCVNKKITPPDSWTYIFDLTCLRLACWYLWKVFVYFFSV